MGAANSAELRAEDYDVLEASSHCNRISLLFFFFFFYFVASLTIFLVTRREIKRLYKRFKFLDSDDSGTISASDLISIPELGNPSVSLLYIRLIPHSYESTK